MLSDIKTDKHKKLAKDIIKALALYDKGTTNIRDCFQNGNSEKS